jgi:putative acetyltransferase
MTDVSGTAKAGGTAKAEALTIRPPVAADLAALAQVAWRSTQAAFAPILPPEILERKRPADFACRFAARLVDLRIAVAGEDGPPLGFSLMTGAHLDMLFVDPPAQGRAVGSALLADAVARGCRTLESFADNDRARRFYEARGFHLCRGHRRIYEGIELPFVLYALERDGCPA